MNFNQIPAGENIPEDIFVFIEIPANSYPIKYEVDEQSGALFVNRFIATTMSYPCNYGHIIHTLSLDGDPLDVLLPTPYPLHPGVIVHCRPIGMLRMSDESGSDSKLIAVPHAKLTQEYDQIKDLEDLPKLLRLQIAHFFEHYKDLESGKWVKIDSWDNADAAKFEILSAVNRANKK